MLLTTCSSVIRTSFNSVFVYQCISLVCIQKSVYESIIKYFARFEIRIDRISSSSLYHGITDNSRIFLFVEGRNGDYEPSREEEEELQRALDEVDKDVRNLERMGQTHGLLEPALLAQLMSDIAS